MGICERKEHGTVRGRKGTGDELTVGTALEASPNIVFAELIVRHSRTKHRLLEDRLRCGQIQHGPHGRTQENHRGYERRDCVAAQADTTHLPYLSEHYPLASPYSAISPPPP